MITMILLTEYVDPPKIILPDSAGWGGLRRGPNGAPRIGILMLYGFGPFVVKLGVEEASAPRYP